MQQRKYDTIIFDLDGTLLDTLEDLADAVNHALREHDMPERTLTEIRQFVGTGARNLIELSVPGGSENTVFEEVFAGFRSHYAAHCNDKTHAYDGVLPLLRELTAEGYALAIVSNKPDAVVKELAEIYFEGLIPIAIGEREGIAKKPAPDTANQALKELGMPRETAVYVGDSEVDIQTAKNAGLPCITVLWGFRDEAFLREQGVSCFAGTPEEVKHYL